MKYENLILEILNPDIFKTIKTKINATSKKRKNILMIFHIQLK